MRCHECGAALPGEELCLARFHSLLAAEADSVELRHMHGLTVLAYYLQHPALTRPWYQRYGAGVMRRIFGGSEAWESVLLENHPRGVGRQRSAAAFARLKADDGATMPDWVIGAPISGELTIDSIDITSTSSPSQQVEAWARSIAEHRFLG